MDEYDAADSQIKTGVMAREAASDLTEAIVWLDGARENAYDDKEEIDELIRQVRELRDKYDGIGSAL